MVFKWIKKNRQICRLIINRYIGRSSVVKKKIELSIHRDEKSYDIDFEDSSEDLD